MGLGLVELVMDVEDTFGVSLPEEVLGEVRTAGDLYDVMRERVVVDQEATCVSAAVFYRLRRELCGALGVERAQIRPTTPVLSLATARDWPRVRRRVLQKLGVIEPPTPRPQWLVWVLATGVFALVMGVVVAGTYHPWLAWLFLGVIVSLVILLDGWTSPRPVAATRANETVGELVHDLVPHHRPALSGPGRPRSEADLWHTFRRVVAKCASVPPEYVTRETDLVRDLCLD